MKRMLIILFALSFALVAATAFAGELIRRHHRDQMRSRP